MTLYGGEDRRKRKIRVLAIDDEEDILTLYKKIANSYNVQLDTTTKPGNFINLFNNGGYDIALVDYIMPINGVVLSRLLKKESSPDTKLYFITSYDISDVKQKINGDSG